MEAMYWKIMKINSTLQKGGLKIYYNYSVRIASETSAGRGNYSSWFEFRTKQSGKKKAHLSATVVVFCCVD